MKDHAEKVLRRRQWRRGEEGAEAIFRQFPKSSCETYVMSGEEDGSAWRKLEFDECLRCSICDRHGEALSSGKIERSFRALCCQSTLAG